VNHPLPAGAVNINEAYKIVTIRRSRDLPARLVGDQQGRGAATDKNQFSENRPQQLGRICQQLRIRP